MIANTTPRLGLMLPGDLDLFDPNDFDTTFGILDSKPGITYVANYGALPSNLTQSQHGSCYMQLDNAALWSWYRPSASAGIWRRVNSLGLLANISAPAILTTTATTAASAPNLAIGSFSCPGGRNIRISATGSMSNNSSPAHACCLGLWVNSTLVVDRIESVGNNQSIPNNIDIEYILQNPTPGASVTVRITPHVSTRVGGGGSLSAFTDSGIVVSEL